MKCKQLKELRAQQYELLQPLKKRQLTREEWNMLNAWVTGIMEELREQATTSEERLLAENKQLKLEKDALLQEIAEKEDHWEQWATDEVDRREAKIKAQLQLEADQLLDSMAEGLAIKEANIVQAVEAVSHQQHIKEIVASPRLSDVPPTALMTLAMGAVRNAHNVKKGEVMLATANDTIVMVPMMDEGEWIVFAFHKDDERQVRRVNSLKRHSELMATKIQRLQKRNDNWTELT